MTSDVSVDLRWAPGVTVAEIIAAMTLEEKVAQLVSLWPEGSGPPGEVPEIGGDIAPMQGELLGGRPDIEHGAAHGLGQLTRALGSTAGAIADRLRLLADFQADVVAGSRFRIPALVHEECLTGLQLYGAATYPTPLAWGASFHPELVRRMGEQIGASMRALGVHLGLAPVLDVVRDGRWGRVEECIGEDPYLVGVHGAAYVDGVQSAGVGATLKHFLGYSASKAGRNLGPVHAGPREVTEVFAVPFEMVVKLVGPQSVMHSYAEIDGVPVAADRGLLTELLRDRWGFRGTVVADYFGVTFLQTLHGVAGDPAESALLALSAGIDVELPAGRAYPELVELVRSGVCPIGLIDTAVERVLRQKAELGVFVDVPAGDPIDLDPPAAREVARQLAEESVVLLSNDGTLPLVSGPLAAGSIALVGPNADAPEALLGNYSFTNHVQVPDGTPIGIVLPTVLDALRAELPAGVAVRHAPGCALGTGSTPDPEAERVAIVEAAALAADADVCVAVVGDRAGLFGRGTVGEGSDAEALELPGAQGALLEALLATGTPLVVVAVTGRPYALRAAADGAAAVLQAFFPGEEGGSAIAGVLTGRVNPSGRLPVSLPNRPSGQPYSHRTPLLGGPNAVSSTDPTPRFAFGHGLSYTSFVHEDLTVTTDRGDTSAVLTVRVVVRNTGSRVGADVVQLYVHDPVASVTRPVRQLLGWQRVELLAGAARTVEFTVPADRLGFVGRDLRWIVEPGVYELVVAASVAEPGTAERITLGGPVRVLGEDRALLTASRVV